MKARSIALVLLSLSPLACGAAALKHIDFNVDENGKSVAVSKFFMDGFSEDDARNKAFAAAQRNDLPAAKKLVADHLAANPTEAWDHYDLAILAEASNDWATAETELKEAQRVDAAQKRPAEKRYADELAFVATHKGK